MVSISYSLWYNLGMFFERLFWWFQYFLLVLIVFVCPHVVSAATYYVSMTGNDTSDGLTLVTPWRSIAKVNASSFVPGDTVYFKRGDVWHEELLVPSSGSVGNPLTIAAYGTGTNPVFSGADVVTTFSSMGWTEKSDGLFYSGFETATTSDFNSLTVSGTNTVRVASSTVAHGQYAIETTFSGVSADKSARLNKTIATSSDVYARAYFYLDPSFDLTASTSRLDIIYLRQDSSINRVRASLLKDPTGNYYIQGRLETPTATTFYAGVPGQIVKGNWYSLELRYKGNVASGGGAELWLDGISLGSNYTYNTSGLTVARVELGANSSSQTTPVSGSKLYFDDLKIATSTIGLFATAGSADIYFASNVTWTARQVMVNNLHLDAVATLDEVTVGTFFQDATTSRLYLQLADSSDPNAYGAEIARRKAAVTVANQQYVTIEDIILEANNNASYGGLTIDGSNHIVVNRATLQKNFGSGISLINNSDSNRIASSTFSANDRDFGGGVRIEGASDDNIIEYNTMSGLIDGVRSGSGVNIRGLTLPTERNIVRYNLIHDMRDSGIYITTNANYTQVYNNIIYSIDDHTGGTSGGNGIHVGNITTAPAYAHDNVIYNNLIYDVATHGITMREGTYNTLVFNNTVFNTGVNRGAISGDLASGSGIDLHSSSDTVVTGISGSRIFNNVVSTCASSCLNVDSYSVTAGGNLFNNNLYYQPSGVLVKWNDVTYTDLPTYQAASGQDGHATASSPAFTDESHNDFTLTALSPAVNTGSSTLGSAYRFAFSNASVVPTALSLLDQNSYGNQWEMGAYVYSVLDTQGPVVSNATATTIGTSTAVIQFTTDELADGLVAYGVTASYGAQTVLSPSLVTDHNEYLANLTPNTIYHYRIQTSDASANVTYTADQVFTTQALVVPPVSTTTVPAATSTSTTAGGGGAAAGGRRRPHASISTVITSTSTAVMSQDALIAALIRQVDDLRRTLAALLAHSVTRRPVLLPAGTFGRDLTVGMQGDDVWGLQHYLNLHGFPVAASGPGALGFESHYFGLKTQVALAQFQAAYHILPSAGYFGVRTRNSIQE